MKKHVVISSFVFLLLFSSVAFGQMMRPGGGPGYHGMWNNYQPTPEEQKAYQEITDKYQADFTKLADKMWAKRARLNAAIAQEKVDRKQVKTLAGEVGELLSQCYALQVEMMVDMREKGLSYYGMGMMHGGMMHGGMMDMMMGGMMMDGQWNRGGNRQYPDTNQPYQRNRGMMQ